MKAMRIGKKICALGQVLIVLMPQWVMARLNYDKHNDGLMSQEYSHSLAFSPDGKQVVLAYESKVIRMWEIPSGKRTRVFKGHTDAVVAVSYSPDGKYILSGSMDNTLKLWDVSSGKVIRTFKGHTGGVGSVAFSQDGQYALAGGEDLSMKVWQIESGNELHSYKGA